MAIQLDASYKAALTNKGLALKELHKYDEALEWFKSKYRD